MNEITRRHFLGRTSLGLGALALAGLEGRVMAAAHRARAKRVIFLCMAGGPSHLETFDPKPELTRLNGKPMPESFTKGQPIAQLQGQKLVCLGSMFPFRPRGESGLPVADIIPHIAGIADKICVIRSMETDQINHDPAHTVMNTGTSISGRPSMGSWINWGIGSESRDLPGFVVLTSVGGRNPQPIASRQWSSGFLPGRFQGVELNAAGDPVHYISNPPGIDRTKQRELIDAVGALERLREKHAPDPERATRLAQYEMAYRMQMSVPELTDFRDEPAHVLEAYGAKPGDGSFASNCLMARRLAERGVRFIQLYHRGWDHHDGLVPYMKKCARLCDRPTAALINDLDQRGLLDDTLVVWGGEFGRTPMVQYKGNRNRPGRDHHIRGFSMFLAGAGVKAGTAHGATDELGYFAVEDKVHVRDLHATMLHLLGIDHQRLTFRHQGLDMRLTGVEPARVVHEILG